MGITGEMISLVFVTRNVHINMSVIFNCLLCTENLKLMFINYVGITISIQLHTSLYQSV